MLKQKRLVGLDRDLNPGPLAPEARIIPLDHQAIESLSKIMLLFENCDKICIGGLNDKKKRLPRVRLELTAFRL